MWPFKRKESAHAQEPTLKSNVTAFWAWFTANAERFYDTIENKNCSDLTDEVSAAFDRWLPDMAWVFGPGERRVGHSLTISGEGVQIKQLVAKYCIDRAPVLANWTFYASRQPADKGAEFTIGMDGDSFKASELWVATYVDDQEEVIDIQAWHPLFEKLGEQPSMTVLFLHLDEILGEFGTGQWIGEIKLGNSRLKDAMPIWELKDYVERLKVEKGWRKNDPTECFSSWKTQPQKGFPRSDIFAGTARCFRLVGDYAHAQGPIEDPLRGLGVDLAYIRIDRLWFPAGKEIDARCDLEDEVAARLAADQGGLTLGGATGNDWMYIDLMLFDGEPSLELVKQVLRKHKLPKDTEVRWFTADKQNQVVRM
ncbi:MAG TPA: hypothetical protein VD994_12710 [Prosthecobacter sp.]|nr:hypothetical protein [Prosthecobacter sp.]